jgi:hypothetical protein
MSDKEIRLKCLELAIAVSKQPIASRDGLKVSVEWETEGFFTVADKFLEYINAPSK